jgi:very-short-patch-repair endonuclease
MSRLVFARKLRNNLTDAEKRLWYNIRMKNLGVKFRRQVLIDKYIVDFACFDPRIVIEIDGGQHADSEPDKVRDQWLETQGFSVLRFWNNEVMENLDGVLEKISVTISPSLNPSPQGGGK